MNYADRLYNFALSKKSLKMWLEYTSVHRSIHRYSLAGIASVSKPKIVGSSLSAPTNICSVAQWIMQAYTFQAKIFIA